MLVSLVVHGAVILVAVLSTDPATFLPVTQKSAQVSMEIVEAPLPPSPPARIPTDPFIAPECPSPPTPTQATELVPQEPELRDAPREPESGDLPERRWLPFTGPAPGGIRVPHPPVPISVPAPESLRAEPATPPAPPRFEAAKPDPDAAPNEEPPYPARARARGWEGTVHAEVDIDKTGLVTAARIVKSSGRGILDRAVTKAVLQWRFRPARRGGQDVASTKRLPPFRFRFEITAGQ